MSFYSNLSATALKLLTKFGQAVDISRDTTSSFNPATGITTPGAQVTDSGFGASFDYTAQEIDGTNIIKGDIRLILNSVTRTPESGDTVTIDSVVYRLMNVEKIAPAGTVVIYDIQLRV